MDAIHLRCLFFPSITTCINKFLFFLIFQRTLTNVFSPLLSLNPNVHRQISPLPHSTRIIFAYLIQFCFFLSSLSVAMHTSTIVFFALTAIFSCILLNYAFPPSSKSKRTSSLLSLNHHPHQLIYLRLLNNTPAYPLQSVFSSPFFQSPPTSKTFSSFHLFYDIFAAADAHPRPHTIVLTSFFHCY